jgi:hypothetical protein
VTPCTVASAPRIRHSARMHRSGKLALGAGFVVVLALAISLVGATRSAPQVAARLPARAPAADPPAPDPWAPPAPTVATREPHPVPSTTRGHAIMPTQQPELPATALGLRRELKRDANGHLVPIIPYTELRAQLHLTDAGVKSCIERSGQRPSGKATLGFTVAARGGKLVIEATSVEDADTLAGYSDLLECMHQTASALAPVLDGRPIPELGTPIYVRRRVRIEDGALVDNAYVNFSYNP